MAMHSPILAPVTLLIAWSLVMWLWMYATRLPAISRQKIALDPTVPPKTLMEQLPPQIRWKADNYNHLMEQPTLFYALALVLALADAGTGAALAAAWFYVVLRIIHSLVQATINKIALRFALHALGTLGLFVMAWAAGRATFLL